MFQTQSTKKFMNLWIENVTRSDRFIFPSWFYSCPFKSALISAIWSTYTRALPMKMVKIHCSDGVRLWFSTFITTLLLFKWWVRHTSGLRAPYSAQYSVRFNATKGKSLTSFRQLGNIYFVRNDVHAACCTRGAPHKCHEPRQKWINE